MYCVSLEVATWILFYVTTEYGNRICSTERFGTIVKLCSCFKVNNLRPRGKRLILRFFGIYQTETSKIFFVLPETLIDSRSLRLRIAYMPTAASSAPGAANKKS